jgi:hypothetical protein
MSVVPCERNARLRVLALQYAEDLRRQAHTIGGHGLTEREFYDSGIFRAAIERIRGQFAATMSEKREFMQHVLNYLEDGGLIAGWESSGEANRHDYIVRHRSGRVTAIELKGCLDGNNTNIFERPPQADEFIIWSVCTNPGADPRDNVWSGVHTRLGAEIIARNQRVDGLVVWDMACGTVGRPCPKVAGAEGRIVEVGPFRLPPPCIYLFPATIPHPRNNPAPVAQGIMRVDMLAVLHELFGGRDDELNFVNFEVENRGASTFRKTIIRRGGAVVQESEPIAIRRT